MADDIKATTDEETIEEVPVEELDKVAGGSAQQPDIYKIPGGSAPHPDILKIPG